jgi:maltose O-acetyltransferase
MTSNEGAGPKAIAKPGKTSSAKFAEADAMYAGQMETLSMKEKSLLGLPYIASDPALMHARTRVRNLLHEYNSSKSGPGSSEEKGANDLTNENRRRLIGEIFQISQEAASRVFVETPFWW